MTRSDEWRDAKIRVLLPVRGPNADTALRDVDRMLDEARIDARTVAVQDAGSTAIVEHSARASIVFIGFEIRSGQIIDPFGNDIAGILGELPPVVLAMAAHDVDLDAQPDEGGAAEEAALRDRLEDAARTLEKAQRAEKAATEALLKAEAALLEAHAREVEPEALEKLRTQVETARVSATQAQQTVPIALTEQQAAEAAAREQGVELPEDGRKGQPSSG